jgi:hypothetical protein
MIAHWRNLVFVATFNENCKFKQDEMDSACCRNEKNKNAYRLLVGKPESKRPLGRSRHKWMNNIKMDLVEIEWGGGQWRAFHGTIKNLRVRFEVFTAVTMKNGVFWDFTPCGSCKNRRFGRT